MKKITVSSVRNQDILHEIALILDAMSVMNMVTPNATPKPLTKDRLQALLQMQRTDPFCKHISKCLSNGKALKHEADLFLHIKGLLYKHITD